MSKLNKILSATLRSPVLWGLLISVGFYAPIETGVWNSEFVKRYFAGHWVEYVETIMFFVGVAELVLKAFNLGDQKNGLKQELLPPMPAEPLPVSEARGVLDSLSATIDARNQGDSYLPRRLKEALDSVCRNDSADGLDEELKYLSEVDAARAHSGYALLRILIWAIPILGFLGTVIGITMAIASLSPEALEKSLPEVTAGLGVAFDTTAIALGLSMGLMFGQFLVDKQEGKLLSEVDRIATLELMGRFERLGGGSDPQLAAVRWMAEAVVKATERMAQRQAEVWQTTIDAANEKWSRVTSQGAEQLESALAGALVQSLHAHAEQLAKAEEASADKNRQNWQRVQQALTEASEAVRAQQIELVRQGEVLRQVVEATGQIARLEETLNGNLAALAGAQHFEETMLNLSGAIHLLNARLGQVAPMQVELKDHTSLGRAA